MLRLIFQLLGLLALLTAPLPAAAIAPPAMAATEAANGHCEETMAAPGDQDEDQADHPCCKGSKSGCCPVVAPLGGSASAGSAAGTGSAHRSPTDAFLPGSAGPPLTQPPTLS